MCSYISATCHTLLLPFSSFNFLRVIVMGAVSKPGLLPLYRVSPNDLKKIIEKMETTAQVRLRRTCLGVHNFMEVFMNIIPTQPEDLQLHINLCVCLCPSHHLISLIQEKSNEQKHITLVWIVDEIEKGPISYPESKLAELAHTFRLYTFKKLVITCKVWLK